MDLTDKKQISPDHMHILRAFKKPKDVNEYIRLYYSYVFNPRAVRVEVLIENLIGEDLLIPCDIREIAESNITNDELKKAANRYGIRMGGKKNELITRLISHNPSIINELLCRDAKFLKCSPNALVMLLTERRRFHFPEYFVDRGILEVNRRGRAKCFFCDTPIIDKERYKVKSKYDFDDIYIHKNCIDDSIKCYYELTGQKKRNIFKQKKKKKYEIKLIHENRQLWTQLEDGSLWSSDSFEKSSENIYLNVCPESIYLRIYDLGFDGECLQSPNKRWLLAHGHCITATSEYHTKDDNEEIIAPSIEKDIIDPMAAITIEISEELDTINITEGSDDITLKLFSSDDPETVILFDQGKQMCRLDGLIKPESITLCDSGIFAIDEYHGDSFFRPLYIFDQFGEKILEHYFAEGIEIPIISSDGKYLALLSSELWDESSQEEDDASLFFFDIKNSKILWKKQISKELPAWPVEITYDELSLQVRLHLPNKDVIRYTYEGELLNKNVIDTAIVSHALNEKYGYELYYMAWSLMHKENDSDRLSGENDHTIEYLLKEALKKELSSNTKARAYRTLGEIAERRHDLKTALTEYLNALNHDPKIGLKKKVDILKNIININI